ncbi:hypothetical protein BRD02_03350 [Halobacteriales archaeon QS_8_69_73]|nr:MAG: hypothetical protein BRD02_03350 [Halobacteriales archaeon QS_8_69_73]
MSRPAVIVSQSGAVTPGLRAVVSASGDDVVETVTVDRREDNRYYLSPPTLDRVETLCDGLEATEPRVVVDGTVHPGQMVDLGERLPSAALQDRRGAILKRLGETNPAAATRFELRRTRIARRAAARDQRDGAADTPSGESGRLAEHDERRGRLRERLDDRQREARRRVDDAYTDVDGHVVLLARGDGTAATEAWTALTGDDADAEPAAGRPAGATMATAAVGPHTVAVTDAPGVVAADGFPAWFADAVPGVVAALEQADLVLCSGVDPDGLVATLAERFDGTHEAVAATPEAVRARVTDTFGAADYVVRLPYGDDAQALLSELHESAAVADVAYGDEVTVRLTVSRSAAESLVRRIEAVGGTARPANGTD